jgi:NADPH:quinone reductase-like Zn-dependent oxidoreductase
VSWSRKRLNCLLWKNIKFWFELSTQLSTQQMVDARPPPSHDPLCADPMTVQSFDGDAFGDGAVLGCDFAGIVEELGPKVSTLVVGDRIAALIWGGMCSSLLARLLYILITTLRRNSSIGSLLVSFLGFLLWLSWKHNSFVYSTYCIADERISFKIPKGLDFPEASTIPLASNTAWLALLSKDCLNIPRSNTKGTSVLVWGGSCKQHLSCIPAPN